MCESEICRSAMDVLVNLGAVVIFLAGVWLDELIKNGGLKEDEFLSFYLD